MHKLTVIGEDFYRSHITFTSVPDIVEITKPLKSIGLSYFTFDRTYQDESHLRLTNAGKWIESYYRTQLYKAAIFEKDPRLFCNGFVFWSWLNREPIYAAAAEHNIEHGLTIIEKHENYTDFFHFGTTCDNFISIEELSGKIDYLYRFIAFFKQRARSIIINSENTRFILPQQNNKIELSHIKPQNILFNAEDLIKKTEISRLYLGDEYENAYLTRREIIILAMLSDGGKTKKIAADLNVSTRTLESHIINIKQKFKCDTLFELGFCLGAMNMQNVYPFKLGE